QLLRPHLVGTLEPIGDLLLGDDRAVVVREAVDVRDRDAVEEHAVVLAELTSAASERLRVHLGPVAGRRPREVNGIELPSAGARRVPGQIAQRLLGHGRAPFSWCWSRADSVGTVRCPTGGRTWGCV